MRERPGTVEFYFLYILPDMLTDDENERKWVTGLIHDDETAFMALYALYKDRLMRFALKFVKSKEIAEDIFQDTFASVWQNRRFIDPSLPFSSYIYTVMRNRLLNQLSRIDTELRLKEAILARAVEAPDDTENPMADADLNALLDQALNRLTPQQRTVFELSRVELKSHKEIAGMLGISVYTVQQHISASLKTIRTCLAGYGGLSAGLILFLFRFNS